MIICDCKHDIKKHMDNGCYAAKTEYKRNTMDEMCDCRLSKETVEARYWARKMMRERDELQLELDFLKVRFNIQELATNLLQSQLEEEPSIEMWTIEEFVKYKKQLEIAEEAIKKARTVVAEKHHKGDMIYLKPNLVAYEILDNALAEINKEGG
jgi:hypothetical protein